MYDTLVIYQWNSWRYFWWRHKYCNAINVTIHGKYKQTKSQQDCKELQTSQLFVKMHPQLHLSYAILVRMSKNVMITLQKYRENPLKISFFVFKLGIQSLSVSTRGHWDCTTLRLYRSVSGWYNLNVHA